jgi:hypothetical protein
MTVRTITSQEHRIDRTILTLDCGHQRSIGGHMMLSEAAAGNVSLMRHYDCQDGQCYSGKGQAA